MPESSERKIRFIYAYDYKIDRMRWGVWPNDEDWPSAIDKRMELTFEELTEIYNRKKQEADIAGKLA